MDYVILAIACYILGGCTFAKITSDIMRKSMSGVLMVDTHAEMA